MTDFTEEDSLSGAPGIGETGAGEALAFFNDSGKIVSARGTEDGFILRIDGRAEWSMAIEETITFLNARRNFLRGSEVSVEWLDRLPTKEQTKELETLLRDRYGIEIAAKKKKELRAVQPSRRNPGRSGVTIPLFDAIEPKGADPTRHAFAEEEELPRGRSRRGFGSESLLSMEDRGSDIDRASEIGKRYANRVSKALGDELFYEEDANAKIIFGTLRSGQRVETPFSLVVVGDVNPGADLIAGGDIIVFGSLRGTAHAAAYEEESPERVIIALQMQPMQLRIGSVISRGSDETVRGAEIARIEDRRIVVEAYNSRALALKKAK